jgi:hypothetical protein
VPQDIIRAFASDYFRSGISSELFCPSVPAEYASFHIDNIDSLLEGIDE